ncbi:MAG TPA: ABC transporter permease subunit [Planctomycetota bacterium]|nr:ABC transporter permease subunit [Planctomycetota bacterium]
MNPLHALLSFELTKLRGRRITWVPFIVLALLVGLVVAVFYHLQFKTPLQLFRDANIGVSSKEDFVNGYYMAAHSMNPVFNLLIPIFISVASELMVAGEAEGGTLRACLIRPVRRRDLILSKFVVLSAYCLALCVFFLLLVMAVGLANFGGGSLFTLNVLFNNGEAGASLVPAAEVPLRFAMAGLIATLGMMVLASLALLVSALVETAAMAYVLTLSIYFTVLTLRMFPALDWLYPYLFVSHMMRWQQCFYSYVKVGDIYVSLVHLAFYLIAFLSAAVLLFNEKDIKT